MLLWALVEKEENSRSLMHLVELTELTGAILRGLAQGGFPCRDWAALTRLISAHSFRPGISLDSKQK